MTRYKQAASLDILAVVKPHVRALKKESSCWRSFCPFHEEKTPSFAIWPETGRWKCYGCGQWGRDAIDFEAFRLKISRRDAAESLLSGMLFAAHYSPVVTFLAPKATIYPEIDWKGYVSRFRTPEQMRLSLWRGYDCGFVGWMVKNEIIGSTEGGCFAFPIKDKQGRIVRAHVRCENGKRWFYEPQKGHSATPLIIGNGSVAHVAESQWDLLAAMNATWRICASHLLADATWIATRGASNAHKLAGKRFENAQIYPQNDEPGRKWAREVASILVPSRIVAIPAEFKDVNDLWKAEKSLARLNIND